jgi:hypothetical protein
MHHYDQQYTDPSVTARRWLVGWPFNVVVWRFVEYLLEARPFAYGA